MPHIEMLQEYDSIKINYHWIDFYIMDKMPIHKYSFVILFSFPRNQQKNTKYFYSNMNNILPFKKNSKSNF